MLNADCAQLNSLLLWLCHRLLVSSQALRDKVVSLKDVFFGAPDLILDTLDSSDTRRSKSVLGRFLALQTFAADCQAKESGQVLWQQCAAAAKTITSPDMFTAASANLLEKSARSCEGLQREVRLLVFDIVCRPVDECVADIFAKVREVH